VLAPSPERGRVNLALLGSSSWLGSLWCRSIAAWSFNKRHQWLLFLLFLFNFPKRMTKKEKNVRR
jgi:hypothetical protein